MTVWKPLAVDHEVIHVRVGKDVRFDVQSTAHGPLLNPIFTRDSRPIALKWTLFDTTLNALPLYEMNTASNWTEFSAALSRWYWPTQNVVYSDDQGHIAYHAVGKVPSDSSATADSATCRMTRWIARVGTCIARQTRVCNGSTFPSTRCRMPSIRRLVFWPRQILASVRRLD